MDYHKIDKKIEVYVTGLFNQLESDNLVYHNLKHTENVVKHVQEIAGHYNLSEREMLILYAAAWFHDTGYLFTEPANHEEYSCQVMKKFMKEETDDTELIDEICACIMATKVPCQPKNLLEQIICDADSYHLGTKEFKLSNKQYFEEVKKRDPEISPLEFKRSSIELLKNQQYFTSYCKELLNKRKKKNINKLEKKLQKAEKKHKEENAAPTFSDVQKDITGLTRKGIQTMLRLTSANHLKLSEMADHKANILISVNSIIISVILSVLVRKLQEETYLIIPTIIFLIVAVATIVVSILATRPKISGGSFTMDEVKAKKTNLLFFGNFHKASYKQYDEAMKELMVDPDYLYGTLIKDIYFLGVVLGKKYRLIRLAYNIFMIGIIISVFAFGIASFFSEGSTSGAVINGSGSPF